jgi:hypothetical protein
MTIILLSGESVNIKYVKMEAQNCINRKRGEGG